MNKPQIKLWHRWKTGTGGTDDTQSRLFPLLRYVWGVRITWTVIIAASLAWNIATVRQNTLETARIQAQVAFEKDVIYRRWNTGRGGVYVPVTKEVQPNPYLSDIPERDITTPSGRLLTLINPAYMTRQVHELAATDYDIRGHITSLKPIRPENAPDAWETEALRTFERGEIEVSSVVAIDGREYMRLMRPLLTEQGCLLCHAAQEYQVGDIRGGISVSIPMEPLWAVSRSHMLNLTLSHGLLWLVGLGVIGVGSRRLARSVTARETLEETNRALEREITERKRAVEATKRAYAELDQIFNTSADGMRVVDSDFNVLRTNETLSTLCGVSQDEAVGKKCNEVFPGSACHTTDCPLTRIVGGEEFVEYDVEKQRNDGTTISCIVTATPFRGPDGDLIGIVEDFRDITKRKRAEEQAQLQLQRVTALHDIELAVTSSLDLRLTLNVLLNQVSNQLKVDATAVFLMDPSNILRLETGQGFRDLGVIRDARVRLGERLAGRAALERQIIHYPNLEEYEATPGLAKVISKEGFVVYYGVPLVAKGELVGVLEIYHRSPLEPDSEWLNFLKTLAGQAAIAISNAVLFDDLQQAKVGMEVSYAKTLEGWVRALDMRDKETEGHTQRVTDMTLHLASFMGIEKDELVHINRGALLHDIGKMAVPDEILHKKESLTDEEWEVIHQHPTHARDFLAEIDYLKLAIDIPYCHHEKWDGSGYPLGLKGREIPLTARIFSVVEVWDALRSDRPYRKAWPRKKALKHIQEQSGKHFDPQVVEAFMELRGEEKLRVSGGERGLLG